MSVWVLTQNGGWSPTADQPLAFSGRETVGCTQRVGMVVAEDSPAAGERLLEQRDGPA